MPKFIVLVEDDDDLRENYIELLIENGFNVASYSDLSSAKKGIDQRLPDLAILDIGLKTEKDGGFELCNYIRRKSETVPIIFLTSYDAEADKVSGMRMGADDYISKDESINYIIVRINSLLRRIDAMKTGLESNKSSMIEVDDLCIDTTKHKIVWKDRPINVSLTQYLILCSLVEHPGHIKSVDQLMDAADINVAHNTIAVHINSLRNGFRSVDKTFNQIKSERSVGYKWSS